MDTRFSVSLQAPQDKNLSKEQLELKRAIQELIQNENIRETHNLVTNTIKDRFESIKQCHGVLVIVFAQWKANRLFRDVDECIFPSEFAHMITVMAIAANKPLLVIREKNVSERGTFKRGFIHPIIDVPNKLRTNWLQTESFKQPFLNWLDEVKQHRHVFLGYSSQAKETAVAIRSFLENKLKVSVLDWHDFLPGTSIMHQIQEAERVSSLGIFLFMADDTIDSISMKQSIPRDNVVYEAGFFAGAKNQNQTLIIKESGAKIPTDFGGVIYLELADRNNTSLIETKLREFIEKMLP